MEGHRRLARARGTADHHEAGVGTRDQIELLRVDQAGDVRQVLVRSSPRAGEIGSEASPGTLADAVDAEGRAFASREARCLAAGSSPFVGACGIGEEGALGRLHPLQGAVADREGAPSQDAPLDGSTVDLLLVLVPLLVAVEELSDRGVTPVDDPQTLLQVGALAQAEIPDPVSLLEAEVSEVGRVAIDPGCAPGLAELLQERRLEVPAGVERRAFEVVHLAAEQLFADPLEIVDQRVLRGRLRQGETLQGRGDPFEQFQLLGHDRVVHASSPPALIGGILSCRGNPAKIQVSSRAGGPGGAFVRVPPLAPQWFSGATESLAPPGPTRSVPALSWPSPRRARRSPRRRSRRPRSRGPETWAPSARLASRRAR